MQTIYWVIHIHFDDDPSMSDCYNRYFFSEEAALKFVNKNLDIFFPFAFPYEEKVKVIVEGNITSFRYLTERVEVRPQIKQ